jgi:hypothetical protein
MRRTLKRTKSKKQQGRVRDLKPVKEVKGIGKIEPSLDETSSGRKPQYKIGREQAVQYSFLFLPGVLFVLLNRRT